MVNTPLLIPIHSGKCSVAILAQDPIHVLGLGSYLSPIGLNWWCGLIDCIGDWICLCIDYWISGDFGTNPPCSVGYTESLSFVHGLHDYCGTAEAATLFILSTAACICWARRSTFAPLLLILL